MICVNDEHPSNMLFVIFWIFPEIINDFTPLKTPFTIDVIEEGIMICKSDFFDFRTYHKKLIW